MRMKERSENQLVKKGRRNARYTRRGGWEMEEEGKEEAEGGANKRDVLEWGVRVAQGSSAKRCQAVPGCTSWQESVRTAGSLAGKTLNARRPDRHCWSRLWHCTCTLTVLLFLAIRSETVRSSGSCIRTCLILDQLRTGLRRESRLDNDSRV